MNVVEGVADVDDVDRFVEQVGKIGAEHSCAIQVLDAGLVASREHLRSAVAHANRSFERGDNVADDRAVEILLYAAGRRQIREALTMGVSEGEIPAVAVVDDGRLRPGEQIDASSDERRAAAALRELLTPDETLGATDAERTATFFDVSPRERTVTDATLSELVRERVALLDVEK